MKYIAIPEHVLNGLLEVAHLAADAYDDSEGLISDTIDLANKAASDSSKYKVVEQEHLSIVLELCCNEEVFANTETEENDLALQKVFF